MAILITGATGLVGTALTEKILATGKTIHFLTTQKSKCINTPNLKGFFWNIETNEIDNQCFNGVTIIIHLAGATIAKRWTKKYKSEIINSRIGTAKLLFEALKKQNHTIAHFISASGVGIYPSDFHKEYTEDEVEQNPEFLGQVVQQWEHAADSFNQINIPVTKIRFGLVLSEKGGVLPTLMKPIQLYAGAILGNGKQWQSWIALPDLVKMIILIVDKNLSGVYNAVSPHPITHKNLTIALSKHLKKPIWLPNIPKFILKIMVGEMHHLLFDSQKVAAQKIINQGFEFDFKTIESVLKNEQNSL